MENSSMDSDDSLSKLIISLKAQLECLEKKIVLKIHKVKDLNENIITKESFSIISQTKNIDVDDNSFLSDSFLEKIIQDFPDLKTDSENFKKLKKEFKQVNIDSKMRRKTCHL